MSMGQGDLTFTKFSRYCFYFIGLGSALALSACQLKLHGYRSSATNITGAITQCGGAGFCVTLTSLTGGEVVAGGALTSINWSASGPSLGSTPISIEVSSNGGSNWSSIAGPIANSGTYSWTSPAGVESPNYRVRVTATDTSGASVSAGSGSNFSVDSLPPALTAGQMQLNGGAANTSNNFVQVSFTATDASSITHFCLRYDDTTAPIANSSCWVPVDHPSVGLTPSKTLTLTNYPFRVGFISGAYTIYAWLKDQLGHITSLGGGTGVASQDMQAITFNAGSPPTIINASAYSTDTPGAPPVPADFTVGNPGNVFIKWNASDDQVLPANPVSLYYTTDDINYTLIVANQPNAAGAGCSIVAAETGCYVWNQAVTATYLRVRIGVIDSNGFTSFVSPSPLNVASSLNFIAGNTDPGINGHALQSVFFNDVASNSADGDPGSLVVTEGGVVYFRDFRRGILKVDPSDGIQRLLIPTTGAASGDGGPISSATLRYPFKIALDYQNRLLVFDWDRIRRINLTASPVTIETIIGGGGSVADGIAPTSLQITPPDPNTYPMRVKWAAMPLFALPNGDIYFKAEDYLDGTATGVGHQLRVYRAATDLVSKITLSGTGDSATGGQDLSLCEIFSFGFSFNPLTSALTSVQAAIAHESTGCNDGAYANASFNPTSWVSAGPHPPTVTVYEPSAYKIIGKDGNLYMLFRGLSSSRIARYNVAGNTWTTLVGTGTVGSCADGTLGTACNIEPYDAYVTAQGTLYFMDRGRIRTLDKANNVATVMGQPFSFGDGGRALSARFNVVNNVSLRNSGEVILLDGVERRFREFTPGGNIQTIAGNGTDSSPATGVAAASQPIQIDVAGTLWDMFTIDPSNGDIFFHSSFGTRILRLSRATGFWSTIVGNGAAAYAGADGSTGVNINISGYPGAAIGFDGTYLLFAKYRYNAGSYLDSFLKLYDMGAAATQSTLIGKAGGFASLCGSGTAWNNCPAGWAQDFSRAVYDAFGTRWLFMNKGTTAIQVVAGGATGSGNMTTLTNLATNASSFAYKRDAGLTVHQIFYCSTTDGMIHKKDLLGATDVALTWPVPGTLSCAGSSLVYDSANNKLVFPFTQNGMYGVAEYLNP